MPDTTNTQPNAPLWCLHITGMDDVVPVASFPDAVAFSAAMNAGIQSAYDRDGWGAHYAPTHDLAPAIAVVPSPWDGNAEHHAKSVAEGNSEHGVPPGGAFPADGQPAGYSPPPPLVETGMERDDDG